MKKFFSNRIFIFLLGFLFFVQSCNNDDSDLNISQPASNADVTFKTEEIASFTSMDLESMKVQLEKSGIDVSNFTIEQDTLSNDPSQRLITNNPYVQAIKISCKTPHPDKSGNYVDASGVLLVPKKTIFTPLISYRIIVAPPPTYTYNDLAPTNAFKRVSLITEEWNLNYLYFWTLQAQSGFVVFIPDYLGFGDSYKQCFHPYLDSKAMTKSILDLLDATQYTLSANGYRYKKELMITGYSQGGFVAASLARTIETDPSSQYSVRLLVTGGTPCDLKQIADVVRHSNYTQHTYFLAYGLWGFKENAYPQINVNDFLQEPYASQSKTYYDGTYKDINEKFPHNPANLYTEKFLKYLDTDPSMAYMNTILNENSVKPWKNKCKFIMTHGTGDVSVYYQNAKDFSDKQNKIGNVTFLSTVGDHVIGVVPYYLKASTYALAYK